VPNTRSLGGPVAPRGAGLRRRRRRVLAASFAATVALAAPPIGLLGGGPLAASGQSVSGGGGHAVRAYVVQPGDTLWSIASRAVPGGDPRPLVERLARELGGDDLQPGEIVAVPR
jgi:hypothetical protein